MAFCIYCGSEVKEGNKFCPSCGSKIDNPSNNSNEESEVVEAEINNEFNEEIYVNNKKEKKDNKNVLCIISSILYPVIALILALLFADSPIGLVLAVVLAILSGLLFYFSGLYLIVIPLYFINFYKWGCARRNFKKGLVILMGILAVLCLIGSIVSTFAI